VARDTSCSIGDDGAFSVFGAVTSHSKLKVLGMEACSMTDVSAVLLAYSVR
jgi:hypothetical protein